MCFHWNDINAFLESHDYVTNKLACLVGDAMQLEYIKVIIAVVASLGVHLIAPFHVMTISSHSVHSSLKEFFTELYDELQNHQIIPDFFSLDKPAFCIPQKLFDGVKEDYNLT